MDYNSNETYTPISESMIHERIRGIPLPEWNSFLFRLKMAIKEFNLEAFVKQCHDFNITVAFNWPEWEEGKKFIESDFPDFTDKDLVFCLKVLTTVIRGDRFKEGWLKSKILDGFMSQLIHRIDELVNDPTEGVIEYEALMDRLFNHGLVWKHRNLRTVFDIDSPEFFETNWREKKWILSRLFRETRLTTILQQYKEKNPQQDNLHGINSLEETLLKYLNTFLGNDERETEHMN
jgi:hypothetical protein